MSPSERAFFDRVHRKAAGLSPEMIAAILQAYRVLAAHLPETEMARLIARGAVETLILSVLSDRALDVTFRPVQQQMRRAMEQSLRYVAKDLPRGGMVNGQLAIVFDVLSPHVVTAIRTLDDKILPTLKADVRETVRQAIQAGLEAGQNPRTIARGLRDVVGLSPAQEQAVRNYRAEVEAGKTGAATSRALHDARFKVTEGMTSAKIDKLVNIYRRNMQAFHAETIARTATLDAFKQGQALAWQQAIDEGIVDPRRLRKTWVQVDRPTKRKAHKPLNGETVPFDAPYSNGQMIPGEGDFNCACLSRFTMARAA